jgi:hypothetical protein
VGHQWKRLGARIRWSSCVRRARWEPSTAGAAEHQQYASPLPHTQLLSRGDHKRVEVFATERRNHPPDALPALGADEARNVEPLILRPDHRDEAPAALGPDLPQNWFSGLCGTRSRPRVPPGPWQTTEQRAQVPGAVPSGNRS